jgi:prepilin-type processing-associated H-X9-DG protein
VESTAYNYGIFRCPGYERSPFLNTNSNQAQTTRYYDNGMAYNQDFGGYGNDRSFTSIRTNKINRPAVTILAGDTYEPVSAIDGYGLYKFPANSSAHKPGSGGWLFIRHLGGANFLMADSSVSYFSLEKLYARSAQPTYGNFAYYFMPIKP